MLCPIGLRGKQLLTQGGLEVLVTSGEEVWVPLQDPPQTCALLRDMLSLPTWPPPMMMSMVLCTRVSAWKPHSLARVALVWGHGVCSSR